MPKRSKIESMNDLRPVALTPAIMKVFERFVLKLLLNEVKEQLDPLQFAYKAKRNVDACLIFTNNILKHLEKNRNYARVLFIDFSSAFKTIQPHVMVQKLKDLNVKNDIIAWVLEFLTHRRQYVKLNDSLSELVQINTGAPQACVLSPTLYTIYTNDYRSHKKNTILIKFADDSTIQGLLCDSEDCYFEEVKCFVGCCEKNFLMLNVKKTKEMIIDFKITKNPMRQLEINDESVETVGFYKYLGFTIDNKLNWHAHVDVLCNKLNTRLFFLKKLKSFHVNESILKMFYQALIQSVITFGISCWGGNITEGDKQKINRSIKKAGKIVGEELPLLNDLYKKHSITKVNDPCHPLWNAYQILGRSEGFITVHGKTERYKKFLSRQHLENCQNQKSYVQFNFKSLLSRIYAF